MTQIPQNVVDKAKQYGNQYGVDPTLLLAIAQHETGFGTLGAGRKGYIMGYGYTDSGPIFGATTTYDQQFQGVAQKVRKYFGGTTPLTQYTLTQFHNQSWKSSDPTWPTQVWNDYTHLKQQGITPVATVPGNVGPPAPGETAPGWNGPPAAASVPDLSFTQTIARFSLIVGVGIVGIVALFGLIGGGKVVSIASKGVV